MREPAGTRQGCDSQHAPPAVAVPLQLPPPPRLQRCGAGMYDPCRPHDAHVEPNHSQNNGGVCSTALIVRSEGGGAERRAPAVSREEHALIDKPSYGGAAQTCQFDPAIKARALPYGAAKTQAASTRCARRGEGGVAAPPGESGAATRNTRLRPWPSPLPPPPPAPTVWRRHV
jgi:hypothetical protein